MKAGLDTFKQNKAPGGKIVWDVTKQLFDNKRKQGD